MRYVCSVVVLLSILLGTQSQATTLLEKQSYLYVSIDDQGVIVIFRIDNQSGDLIFVKSIPAGGKPGPFIIDQTHKLLYAAISSNKTVRSFRIDENTGDLSLLGSVDISWNPTFISTDRKGRYLLLTFFSDNKTSVFSIAENGAVQSGAIQVLSAERNPHSILIDKSNQFVFVPCRTAEAIQQYRFNEVSGLLSSNVPDKIASPDSTGPRHIASHPFLGMVYVVNEFGRSVTGYKIDAMNGTLTKLQTLTMQPEDPQNLAIVGNQGGADIKITPDGRFLYATNRVPDKIVAYEIDELTGYITFIENYATEKLPRSFDIDPSGKFIYVGGQSSGKIAAYRIDPSNGKLTSIKTYTVGNNPAWVAAVELNSQNTSVVEENINNISLEHSLGQNYPNPFNPQTTIRYKVSIPGNATLKVFDLRGREIATLMDEYKQAGLYRATFNTSESSSSPNMTSGVYFYTLRVGNVIDTKKMILLK